jgi:hypothetical protein
MCVISKRQYWSPTRFGRRREHETVRPASGRDFCAGLSDLTNEFAVNGLGSFPRYEEAFQLLENKCR